MTALMHFVIDLPPAAAVMIKATALMAIGCLLSLAFSQRNPRWRVLVWRLAMAGLILLAPAEWLLPKLRLTVEPPPTPPSAVSPAPNQSAMPIVAQPAMPDETAKTTINSPAAPSIGQILLTHKTEAAGALWLVVVMLIAVRSAYVAVQVRRLVRSASPPPDGVRQIGHSIAEAYGCRAPDLRITQDLLSPFVAGIVRPVVVVPALLTQAEHRHNLPSILAHEFAHIRSRDLAWMALARWISIALWFHPLAWWMRQAHSAACEEVCDGIAAGQTGGASNYSRALASTFLELVVDAPQPVGVPLIRPSEIMRRITRLRRGMAVRSLHRSSLTVAYIAALFAVVALGSLKLAQAGPDQTPMPANSTRAERVRHSRELIENAIKRREQQNAQSTPAPVDPKLVATVTGTLIDNPSKEPVAGTIVTIKLASDSDGPLQGGFSTKPDKNGLITGVTPSNPNAAASCAVTGKDGMFKVSLPMNAQSAEAVIEILSPRAEFIKSPTLLSEIAANAIGGHPTTTRLEHLVKRTITVSKGEEMRLDPILMPPLLVAGVIKDNEGKPLEGVDINGMMVDGARGGYSVRDHAVSGRNGRFELRYFPESSIKKPDDKGRVVFNSPAVLPYTIDDIYTMKAEELTSLQITMDRGKSVSGTLMDSTGKPDAGVIVEAYDKKLRKAVCTDHSGRFALSGLPSSELTIRTLDSERWEKIKTPLKADQKWEDIQLRLEPIKVAKPVGVDFLGMKVADVTPELQDIFDLHHSYGVVVLDAGAKGNRKDIGNIQAGYYFWMVGNKKVHNLREMVDEILRLQATELPPGTLFVGEGYHGNVRVVYGFGRASIEGTGTNTQYLKLTAAEETALKELSKTLGNNATGDWRARFDAVYRLDHGQILKRIGKPFIPERFSYFADHNERQARNIPEGPEMMVFRWDGTLKRNSNRHYGDIKLKDALESLVKWQNVDYEGAKDLLELRESSDWIAYSGASTADLLNEFSRIVTEVTGRKLSIKKKTVERDVIVARGQYEFNRDKNAPINDVFLYIDKLTNDDGSGGGAGNFKEFLDWVGGHVRIRVIDETQTDPSTQVSWSNCMDSQIDKIDNNPAKIDRLLTNLSRQTSLEFKKERRPVEMWFVSEEGASISGPSSNPAASRAERASRSRFAVEEKSQ